MKKLLFIIVFFISPGLARAQNEIGPEGKSLLWIILAILGVLVFLGFKGKTKKLKAGPGLKKNFFRKRIQLDLEKDRIYYPDFIKLTIRNTGKRDVDIERPLLIFSNFWIKRKFRLKGTGNYRFYPMYLDKDNSHTLNIDLNGFYSYDKKLKKYPKIKIVVFDVNGKQLGGKSIYIRKTLFK